MKAVVLALCGLFLLAGIARANCTNPAMPAGSMFYNVDHEILQYCKGSTWVGVPGPGFSCATGDTIVMSSSGWACGTGGGGGCGDGWITYGSGCYKITSRTSYSAVRSQCQAAGADLIVINDAAEDAFALAMVTPLADGFWIGYNDIASEGTFTWVTGSSTYTNWDTGEPNNSGGNEDCVALWANQDGFWHDANCTWNAYGFCEKAGTGGGGGTPCTDDATGECLLEATRSNDDPEFLAENICNGFNVLGVTGTANCSLGGGSPTQKIVFTTSTTYNGNLGGVAGADAKCAARATAAGLTGTFKAWISEGTSGGSLRPSSTFTNPNVPYKLVDGTVVADNWTDLVDGTLDNAISLNESGGGVGGSVWTNTTTAGNQQGMNGCSTYWNEGNWGPQGRVGNPSSATSTWTSSSNLGCEMVARLYCFEQ